MDPSKQLKEVAGELQEKFKECGMDSVDQVLVKLEDIKTSAAGGPQKILDAVQQCFEEFKSKIDAAMNDPSSLAPSGGMAACASWYGNSVVGKLKTMSEDSLAQLDGLKKMGKDVTTPMKTLADTLEKAMTALASTLTKLSKLPAEVGTMASTIDSPDDIAKIDVDSMKKCLDISGIGGPLDSIGGLKGVLGGLVDTIKEGITKLKEFIESAPDTVREAFQVPPPLCFATSMLLSQPPQPMTDMLAGIDKLKNLDLQPLVDSIESIGGTLSNLDVASIKGPVEKFAASASDPIEKLDKAVKGAKMASNPAGAIGGTFGK
jgi:uncharacterized phage infection (PIP) family protein YhgE